MLKQKLNDRWFRFLGIPLVAVMGHLIFFNRNTTGQAHDGPGIYLLSLTEAMVLWEANRLVILYFRKKCPALQETTRRIVMVLIFCTLVTIAVRSLNIFIYDKTHFRGYRFPIDAYLKNIFIALLFVIVVGGIYEAIYYFRKWKDIAVESEALKKENLQTQLETLKTQLSPHFLFNSLGSLLSLIEENPKKAQEFVIEMSSVYRYLLQSTEQDLTPLRNEMDFIHAYYGMLKTRFPEGLQLDIRIGDRYLDYILPPLTVQILLENAVKHNAVLPSRPLHVEIYTDDAAHLIILNNLQKKTSSVSSNKMGLVNIISKYKLLNHPAIRVKETATHFEVIVPLIKKT